MHKFLKLILPVTFAFILFSCDGDPGPPGLDGETIIGQVIEIEADFNVGNDFSTLFEFPLDVEVFESDAVLVYLLEDVVDDGAGGTLDVWTPLPQSFFLDQGTLQVTFNHTFVDVSIFLDGNFDLATTPVEFTDNQVFRIAIVPAEFAQNGTVDISNLTTVMSFLNISDKDISRIAL